MAKETVTTGYVIPDSWEIGGLLEQDADLGLGLGLVMVGRLARYPVASVTLTGKLRRTSRLGTFGIRCRVEFLEAEGMGPAVVHGWMTDPRLV